MAKREYSCCRSWLILIVIGVSSPGTYSFKWNSQPETITVAEIGKSVVIKWSYDLEKDGFVFSDIKRQQSKYQNKKDIAFRRFEKYELYQNVSNMNVNGDSDVSLTIVKIKLSLNMSKYCCDVKSTKGSKLSCTQLLIYERPKIINITPNISATQGSSVNMKCNASGDPVPNYFWTKKTDMNHERLDNSSKYTFNITGKESTGNYCCVADNNYANDRACMFVYVTGYRPLNTTIRSSRPSLRKGSVFNVTCTADALPPANYTFHQVGKKPYHSMGGFYSTSTNTDLFYENITCVAINKHGRGPSLSYSIPIRGVPLLLNTTPVNYTMTNTSVKIACEAKGYPTPKILWIDKSNKIINQSTDGNYTVSFRKCSNEILTYYCIGSNSEGNTSRKRITLHVNTMSYCDDTPGREIQEINTWMPVLIVTLCCAFLVILTTVLSMEWSNRRKRKKSLNMEAVSQVPEDNDRQPVPSQTIEESPYGEPIDAIKQVLKRGCQGDYATTQDIRVNRNKRRTTSNSDDDNLYASVINSKSPKKNENKQSTERSEIPLMALYEEIPGQTKSA